MESTTKSRTPSRCREWERQRRNKFNEAISKLGEIVKSIIKENNCNGKEYEDIQYPKIEIIQKAILCLTNCIQEKTQLKAEVLALQVKLETTKGSNDKRDASTQVYIGMNKKTQNGKYVKLVMLKKSKSKAKEKPNIPIANTTEKPKENDEISTKDIKKISQNTSPQKLPMLLPRTKPNDKKGSDNTIVVLPATPYLFPQRPLLFPAVPPAIVLVDPNMPTLNKSTLSLINRNGSDITKTTMVNILPISAYSRPLSATKTKKYNLKTKHEMNKKGSKKTKVAEKNVKKPLATNEDPPIKPQKDSTNENIQEDLSSQKNENLTLQVDKPEIIKLSSSKDGNIIPKISVNNVKSPIKSPTSAITVTDPPQSTTESLKLKTITNENTKAVIIGNIEVGNNKNSGDTTDIKKTPSEKAIIEEKEDKLTNILDTTLCENVVDGGNARLELAEEFLAASPTAAFLMSFPLVSGNRAESPAEETQNTVPLNHKESNQRRHDPPALTESYFGKTNSTEIKIKSSNKSQNQTITSNKQDEQHKYLDNNIISKQVGAKSSNSVILPSVSSENPFLPMSSRISTNCTPSDSTFSLDFECNMNKSMPNQSSAYVSNNNFFYKSDPFNTVKNSIYSTSNISTGHEFNSIGLYPCAMEKYSSKNKTDYSNVEDNLMKIGSSRLTYDIDLGWSHKGFDFVNCSTTSTAFNKDTILTTVAAPYSTTYNPFNPEFHMPLVSSANKKDITNKANASFVDPITTFYSQPPNLWPDDMSFYTNNTMSKTLTSKSQNYLSVENVQNNLLVKPTNTKQYETKPAPGISVDSSMKSSNVDSGQQMLEKFSNKKSTNKMHINWMTSEIRPIQNNCNTASTHTDIKDINKPFNQNDVVTKKIDHNENNYFPISIHNFTTQTTQEDFQVWPSARPLGTTEISIEPPPINLPTLVGDLALGPHEKRKNADITNRGMQPSDVQNCNNFLSVTQLMNRSSDHMSSRYHSSTLETTKSINTKQNMTHYTNDLNRKTITRLDNLPQPYVFSDSKQLSSYDGGVNQFSQSKSKVKTEKSSKTQKNSYSAEALIRGGNCTQKPHDNINSKFNPAQKYNDYTAAHDSSIAQVSHFPPILDYSDNGYASQQFSGTTLYNSTTNTISNSFYSNFIPGSSNLVSSNYTGGHFGSEFFDYNQSAECNYSNHKYEELKMKNSTTTYHQDKVSSNYKNSRRESAAKHKLECSKKESNKKYQNKRPKVNNDADDWSDTTNLLWQTKTQTKRHSNLMSEELPFSNYVSNQVPGQYQSDVFNSHFLPSNVQGMSHNVDRSLASIPVVSRANFNLSTIFPEITMKVQ